MFRFLIVATLLSMTACLPEIRVGPKEGVPPISGSTEIPTDLGACGEPVAGSAGTATTRKVAGGCELTFTQDVQVLDESDYAQISNLTSFSGLLEAVELRLEQFDFVDVATNTPVNLVTQVTAATLSINGLFVADKTILTSLPKTLRLSGPALSPVKDAIYNHRPVSLRINAVVVLPDNPPPPRNLRFIYQGQPTLVLGGSL